MAVSDNSKPNDPKSGNHNERGCDKPGHTTQPHGSVVSPDVQNDRQKQINREADEESGRDTIEIAVDRPRNSDFSRSHILGSKVSTAILGNGDNKQGVLNNNNNLDTFIKVYIDGSSASEYETVSSKSSTQSKAGPQYGTGTAIGKADSTRVSDTYRQRRSPVWGYSHSRRRGRRTWKRYKDVWKWYYPYKNSFDPLASNIIG